VHLIRALAGLVPLSGTLTLDGAPIVLRTPGDAVRRGIGYIPEDRKGAGLALEQSVANNIVLASLHRISKYGFTDTRARTAIAMATADRWESVAHRSRRPLVRSPAATSKKC